MLASGTRIEFKYKNKHWRNGEILSKTNTEMVLSVHKSLYKIKKVTLKMADVLRAFHVTKTLRVSNKVYPSWIAVNADVLIDREHYRVPEYGCASTGGHSSECGCASADGHSEWARIAHYRDNRHITLYFPSRQLLKIKQSQIVHIDQNRIQTRMQIQLQHAQYCAIAHMYDCVFPRLCRHDGCPPFRTSSRDMMVHGRQSRAFADIGDKMSVPSASSVILDDPVADRFDRRYKNIAESLAYIPVPVDVCVMICRFAFARSLCLYRSQDVQRRDVHVETRAGKLWPVNTKHVYGVQFRLRSDYQCEGIEVDVQFGSIRTYIILVNNKCSYKGVMDEAYDMHGGLRKFIWEDGGSKLLAAGDVCKIGFFISDGASVLHYADQPRNSPQMSGIPNCWYVRWQLFFKSRNLKNVQGSVGHSCYEAGNRYYNHHLDRRDASYDWFPFVRLL